MNRHTFTRTIAGLAIIAVGVMALLNGLDLVNYKDFLADWWPSFVIGGGLLLLINSPRQFVWPLVVIMTGVLLQLRQFDLVTFNVWQLFWPVILIIVGLSFITNRSYVAKTTNSKDSEEISAILGGSETKSQSSDYKGGKITAIFGGVTIDLREAKITDEATLQIFAFCGGVDIKVPENWVVKSKTSPVFGGVNVKTNTITAKNAPTLIIAGDVIFGGVDVKH